MKKKDTKIMGIVPDDAHPKEMSMEEAEKEYGIQYGPCRLCQADAQFYVTDPIDGVVHENQPVAGNYCVNCFMEEYPEAAPDMKNLAEKLESWIKKRFSH